MKRTRVTCILAVLGCHLMYGTSGNAQSLAAGMAQPVMDTRTVDALLSRPVSVALTHVSMQRAIDAIMASAGVRVTYRVELVTAVPITVTYHATRVPLGQVLDHVLMGTHLQAVPIAANTIKIASAPDEASGTITGRVIDAQTKRPVVGASVTIDAASHGVFTGEDGIYHYVGVSAGPHTMTIKYLGYARETRRVAVADGETITVNIVFMPSASVLDQVVVTGTVIPTELKAVPNAMTVITAKQIEERGITKIDQLFRGDVPGVFAMNLGSGALLDEVSMFSRGATALSSASAGVDQNTGVSNPIKTYVDGVELADPKYISQIDPKSIERIEILTGPQASTIYGSNAINGVMQIFTKRGTSNTPQLTLNLLSGFVQNNFSSAITPQHDYSAQLNGIEGRLSYNAGGSWSYIGPWTPAKQTSRLGSFGGARLDLATPVGRVTADVSLRYSTTQNQQRGNPQQTQTRYGEQGWYSASFFHGQSIPQTRILTGQTLGLNLSYTIASWWSHELGVGQDASDTEWRYTARGYQFVFDTMLFLQQSRTDRRSIRYATTAHIPVASLVHATVTAGADAWQNVASSWYALSQTLTGSLIGSTGGSRQPGHNAGGFLQSQLGISDHLFLTYGLRAEWNPAYGEAAQPNYAPRYGIAYTQEFGSVTAKVRGSYGRSTRPPLPNLKAAQTVAEAFGTSWTDLSPYYTSFDFYLANPDLAPEHQQGGEGGLEVYFGTHGSVVITRYNQTVDGLIDSPRVDSVRSLTINPPFYYSQDTDGYGYIWQYQNLNIGSIRNQGWELQGSVNLGPLTTHGTYSWTKSRTIGVNSKYRDYFALLPQYHPGATFQYLPEHTWALGVTYTSASSSAGLNLTGTGQTMLLTEDEFSVRNLSGNIRLRQNKLRMNSDRYVSFNKGYALADLTASHRFRARIEGVLQVQNLTNYYANDYYAVFASMGRQLKGGFRIR